MLNLFLEKQIAWRVFYLCWAAIHQMISIAKGHFQKSKRPVHILFCTVDHYEPGNGNVSVEAEKARVDTLLREYPILAGKHRDGGGNMPKRTWFFPPHYHRNGSLRKLVALCEQGYGEIELHLHHGTVHPDTSDNLSATLKQCVYEYSQYGIFGSQDGQKRYAFIHGDWALNNSRHGQFCGVNDELSILQKTGCYADFTFPSLTIADPWRMLNKIFYADTDLRQPKSYRTGSRVCYKSQPHSGLMIIQGPVYPFRIPTKAKGPGTLFGLRAIGDAINVRYTTTPKRIDSWIKSGIHVAGKRNWLIVKTSTHGAVDADAVLGRSMDSLLTYLEQKYNDGIHFVLHYVTARELYNIIKAAEAGEAGDNPEEYRDYAISPPAYDSSVDCLEASDQLKNLLRKTCSHLVSL